MMGIFKKQSIVPHLASKRITLRPPQISDFESWRDLRLVSHDFLKPWEPVLPPEATTKKGYENRLRLQQKQALDGYCQPFYIFTQEGALVGGININRITRGFGQMATLGYWVGAPYARQGYMSETLNIITRHAFDKMGLHRLEAGCLLNNIASRALLEKSGFVYEGIARKLVKINGEWQDHAIYARLCDD